MSNDRPCSLFDDCQSITNPSFFCYFYTYIHCIYIFFLIFTIFLYFYGKTGYHTFIHEKLEILMMP